MTVLYGGLETLKDTLPTWYEAIRDLPVELVVVDNTPDDSVAEFVDACLGSTVSTYIHSSQNVGFAAAANRGAEVARTQFLLFLNADVYLTRVGLSVILDLAPNTVVAALRLNTGGVCFEGVECSAYGFLSDRRLGSSRTCLGPSGGGGLFRRELFLEMGGFHPLFFAWGEDAALAVRLARLGISTTTLPVELDHVGGHSVASLEGQRFKARLLVRNRIWTFRRVFSRSERWKYGLLFFSAIVLNGLRKAKARTLSGYLTGVLEGLFRCPTMQWPPLKSDSLHL